MKWYSWTASGVYSHPVTQTHYPFSVPLLLACAPGSYQQQMNFSPLILDFQDLAALSHPEFPITFVFLELGHSPSLATASSSCWIPFKACKLPSALDCPFIPGCAVLSSGHGFIQGCFWDCSITGPCVLPSTMLKDLTTRFLYKNFFFDTRSHVAGAGLKLNIKPRMALNSWSF